MGFLFFAVALSIVGAIVVVVHHRRPTSMDASIEEFHRSLRALAPPRDERTRATDH
jgi:hypothetical protein